MLCPRIFHGKLPRTVSSPELLLSSARTKLRIAPDPTVGRFGAQKFIPQQKHQMCRAAFGNSSLQELDKFSQRCQNNGTQKTKTATFSFQRSTLVPFLPVLMSQNQNLNSSVSSWCLQGTNGSFFGAVRLYSSSRKPVGSKNGLKNITFTLRINARGIFHQ